MKASLNNYRQSPRKVRIVTDLIKGKSVTAARIELSFLPKRAAKPILMLLNSAVSNSKVSDPEKLFIKTVTVDKGTTLKRMRPRAMGTSKPINKRMSNVSLTLQEPVVTAKSN